MTAISNPIARPIETGYIDRRHQVAAPFLEGTKPLLGQTTCSLPKGVVAKISAYLAFDCSKGTFSNDTLGDALANGTIPDFYQKVVDVFAKNNKRIMMHERARDLSDFTQFTDHYLGFWNREFRPIKRLLQQEPKIYDGKGILLWPKNPEEGFLGYRDNIDNRLTILCGACFSIYNHFFETTYNPFLETNFQFLTREENDIAYQMREQERPFRAPFRIFAFLTFGPEDFLATAESQDAVVRNSRKRLYQKIFEIAMRNREFFPFSIRTSLYAYEKLALSDAELIKSEYGLQPEKNSETTKRRRIQNYLAQEASNQSQTLSSSSSAPSSASATAFSAANTTTSGSSTSSTASSTAESQKASENKEAC